MYRELSAPFNCQLELTTTCSNRCLHCYNYWRTSAQKDVSLSSKNARKIMLELANAKVFEVTFTGGEPMLNFSGLAACLEVCRDFGIISSLNSILTPFSAKQAKFLKSIGLNKIMTSVLGPDAHLHDSIAQKNGAFGKTIVGIKTAQDAGIQVCTSMVISKHNLHAIKETASFISSLGIQIFLATKACHPSGCADFSSMALTNDQFTEYLEVLTKIQEDMGMKCGYLEPYPECALSVVKGVQNLGVRKCMAGVSTCTLSSSGGIRACSSLDFEYGNIFVDGLTKTWQRMKAWREGVFLPKECRDCELVYVCGGGCRMEAKMHSGGDLCAIDPYAKPYDIAEAVKLRRENVSQKIGGNENVTVSTKFQLVCALKWRSESFGVAVMADDPNRIVLLGEEGSRVIKQFKPGLIYEPHDHRIDWNGVDPLAFCTSLIGNGLAIVIMEA